MDDFTKMSDFTSENLMVEREGVFNEEKTKRFELTYVCSGIETVKGMKLPAIFFKMLAPHL